MSNRIHDGSHSFYQQQYNVGTGDICVNDKAHKVSVVIVPNTVVYPRAMMIHFQHTASTVTTMMASWWFVHIAALAVSGSSDAF